MQVRRTLEVAARALGCLVVGLLRRDDLEDAITRYWQQFGATRDHALSGLMPWEGTFYARVLKPDDTILVVGSGTGRDVIALLRAGYAVEGLEPAEKALALAQSVLDAENLHARLTVGRIEAIDLGRSFDVLIFSWFCYSYIPGRERRLQALMQARKHLRPGGRIVITYLPAPDVFRRVPLGLTDLMARLSGAGWRTEPTDVFDAGVHGVHFEHCFMPGELEREAEAVGLRVVLHERTAEGLAVLS